mmetsp:Transcript_82974/g.240028  ORF Transcript_82974/g.240028 Transcript_82974/m.240028 type:complete len:240 (-) Transcript_82974:295-1014(-)
MVHSVQHVMLSTSMSPFAGLWNHVVLLMPETFTACGMAASPDACTPPRGCSTDEYISSFHTKIWSTIRFTSSIGIGCSNNSGIASDNLGNGWFVLVPAHRNSPNKSKSSADIFVASVKRAGHATCKKCSKLWRTNASIAAEASRPRAMELCCAETPTRGEVPLGEARGELTAAAPTGALSRPGHMSPARPPPLLAKPSVRTRCGLKTWHMRSRPMTLMSNVCGSVWPQIDCCRTMNTCQ